MKASKIEKSDEYGSRILKNNKIRFSYDYNVYNGIDPNNVTAFCQKFVAENVILVKVEMATKSLTRCQFHQLFFHRNCWKFWPFNEWNKFWRFLEMVCFFNQTVNMKKSFEFLSRSIKDQKFNFVGQLSSLGKTLHAINLIANFSITHLL